MPPEKNTYTPPVIDELEPESVSVNVTVSEDGGEQDSEARAEAKALAKKAKPRVAAKSEAPAEKKVSATAHKKGGAAAPAPEATAKPSAAPQRPRRTPEERREYRQTRAADPRARVLICEAPLSYAIASVLENFDRAYAQLKLRLGEPRGISHAEADEIMASGRQVVADFDSITASMHRKLGWRYTRSPQVRELLQFAADGTK